MRDTQDGERSPVITATGLWTSFMTETGYQDAVRGVSFQVSKGEIVGIVGESGSGKSTIAMSLMQLHEKGAAAYSGTVEYSGRNLVACSATEIRQVRGAGIGMIFQDPQSSLNPVYKVGRQIREAVQLHRRMSRTLASQRALELLDAVGIPDPVSCFSRYPHELSGGMKQRVMIAIAIASDPEVLIADEPTTALDVTVQDQILELIRSLSRSREMSVIFISHDLAVVSQLCDSVLVMYQGEIVERGPTAELFRSPRHPYTKKLLSAALLPSRDELVLARRSAQVIDGGDDSRG
ncbi:ABC transporter ATP-binding protein [Microbacterium sp. YY-01]|uniref:ABC transporter ATP-binding protein n=1 Tax=Microbacterium sp. YY-01 TaxID=3421634 RepID=UPI003D17881C